MYNGVEFTGNTELTEEQLEGMYQNVISPEQTITPFAVDPGSSYVSVIAPTYKTYNNTAVKVAAELVVSGIVAKSGGKITKSIIYTWTLGRLQSWGSSINHTYVGGWVSSSYVNSQRRYYETLTRYKNSNYTSPTSVQYYDVTLHWK